MQDEQRITHAITTAANAGYPFTPKQLRGFVQNFLNRMRVDVKCFSNNLPGPYWLKHFPKRNKNLSVRLAENRKRCRAALSEESVNAYFDEFSATAKIFLQRT